MKILIEQYGYDKGKLSRLLDSHYYTELQNNVAQIPYVGYFLSHKIPDTVFILPKVFVIDGKAFGKYAPEDIIDFDKLDDEDKKAVFSLSVWIYRAIKQYSKRKGKLPDTTEIMQNVVSHHGSSSETMIDIILSLLKFHKDHQNLFTYITRIRHSGQNKIHWQKTISKAQPFMQNGRPFYIQPHTKHKEINYDEELIVLFFSVLNYLNIEFCFDVRSVFGYDLLKPSQIKSMIESGKGTRILRQNRRKYFTDEMVQLWNLLFTFFIQSENVQSKSNSDEQAMLVRDFNLVFEDMIDTLIGESKLPKGLKEQKDGKIIDHIYRDHSLIEADEDVYFIGDSKYYKEDNAIGTNSIYKQFTYAHNVIQYNMDIYNHVISGADEYGLEYRDNKTEGYNITPNFFIRGYIDKDELTNYTDSKLQVEGVEKISYHFENRLFDRDTLILQSYNINFLFVLSAYVQGPGEHTREVRKIFRENVKEVLQRRYDFYAIKPKEANDAELYLKENFQTVLGKVYAPYDKRKTNCLSLALCSDDKYVEENDKLRADLEQHFFMHAVNQKEIDKNPEEFFGSDEQTVVASFGAGMDKNARCVLTGMVRKDDEQHDKFRKGTADTYIMEKVPAVNLMKVRYFMPMVGGMLQGCYEVEDLSMREYKGIGIRLKLKLGKYTKFGDDQVLVAGKMKHGELISIAAMEGLYFL